MDGMFEGDWLRRSFAECPPVPAGDQHPDHEDGKKNADKQFEKDFSHMFV
jgi:hypothetical protein